MTEQFSAHRPDVELEEILQDNITDALPIQPYRGEVRDQVRLAVQHVVAAGYYKPRTITTAEELDALPSGSVIIDSSGEANVFHDNGWVLPGGPGGYTTWAVAQSLPATVLYEPQP